MHLQPLFIVLLAAVGVIGVWYLSFRLFATLSGWAALARRFRAPKTHPAPDWLFYTLSLEGGSNYRCITHFRISPAGLFISLFPSYSIGHPPLLVPWDAFGPLEINRKLWGTYHEMVVNAGKWDNIRLSMPASELTGEIAAHLPQTDPNR